MPPARPQVRLSTPDAEPLHNPDTRCGVGGLRAPAPGFGAAGIATALAVASPASAFECYNANRSDQGNASAAKAPR